MPKLTKRFIEKLQPEMNKSKIHWDSELKGFGVVVHPTGRKTYCIQYRNLERVKKQLKIGTHGHISTEEARELAKKKLASVTHGKDPVRDKKEFSQQPYVADLAKEYMEKHGPQKRVKSQDEDQSMLENYILPDLGKCKVRSVRTQDIQKLHLKTKLTPYRANRILSLLSKMFSLAISWGWRDDNPAAGIQRYQEEKRDRWLDTEELRSLWNVLGKYPTNLISHLFKLLLLTGARKGELMNATWDQFDLEKALWIKPSHLTKQKKKEYLPLSAKALEVLDTVRNLKQGNSSFLFPGRIEGEPIKEIKTFWKKILQEANLENVRIHDLRHTHASHLVSSRL